MKKELVVAMAMAMGVTASAYAANPFSDVPAGHWAYDSISKLESAGVIDGYGAIFGGEKLMTRYEMAQIVAKAMAKGANCDKLAAEFADELDNFGVRVTKLEKKVDNVKITGNIRYSYKDNTKNSLYKQGRDDKGYNRFRSRLFVSGQINNNWKYTGMLENDRYLDVDNGTDDIKLKRAFLTGRLGGVKVTAGRVYALQSDMVDANSDGIMASYNFDKVKLSGWALKNCDYKTPKMVGSIDVSALNYFIGDYFGVGMADRDRLYMGKVEGEFGDLGGKYGKLNAFGQFWKIDSSGIYASHEIYEVGVSYPVYEGLKLGINYYNGNNEVADDSDFDDNGWEASLTYKGAKAAKKGSWGAWVTYMDRPVSTYLKPTAFYTYAYNEALAWILEDGYKGFELGANYTFAKNIVGTVRYYELKGREDTFDFGKIKCNTLWADVTFTF